MCITRRHVHWLPAQERLKQRFRRRFIHRNGSSCTRYRLGKCHQQYAKSHYPVLFIVSLALGGIAGTALDIAGHFDRLVDRVGKSNLGKGLATEILLCCIGALSIVGPVMAAVKGDNTMLYTNAMMDFVTSMVFGASFGWGMLLVAPVLFCWQGSIYLVAKFLSASFFTGPLVAEISIVGGFLIACSGLALLKIRDVKTLNFLPSLLVPIIFFIIKDLTGWF